MTPNPEWPLAEEYWSGFFGCDRATLMSREDDVLVVPHVGLGDYRGIWSFRAVRRCIISAPQNLVADLQSKIAGQTGSTIHDAERLASMFFPRRIERIIGRCLVGYVDSSNFRPLDGNLSRQIASPINDPLFAKFQMDCGEDFATSGIDTTSEQPVFGVDRHGQLAAAASFEVWGNRIAHIGVVTHPQCRGQGFAKSVASAAAVHCFAVGLLPQWRTLESNFPSIAVAAALGFRPFATHYAIRLRT